MVVEVILTRGGVIILRANLAEFLPEVVKLGIILNIDLLVNGFISYRLHLDPGFLDIVLDDLAIGIVFGQAVERVFFGCILQVFRLRICVKENLHGGGGVGICFAVSIKRFINCRGCPAAYADGVKDGGRSFTWHSGIFDARTSRFIRSGNIAGDFPALGTFVLRKLKVEPQRKGEFFAVAFCAGFDAIQLSLNCVE